MWMKFVEIMWIYAFRFNFFLYVIWRFHKTEGEGLLISTKYFLMLLWMAFYWASWRNICSILWCQICVTSLLKVFSLVAELQSGCQVIFDRGYVFLTSLIGGSVGPAQSCSSWLRGLETELNESWVLVAMWLVWRLAPWIVTSLAIQQVYLHS